MIIFIILASLVFSVGNTSIKEQLNKNEKYFGFGIDDTETLKNSFYNILEKIEKNESFPSDELIQIIRDGSYNFAVLEEIHNQTYSNNEFNRLIDKQYNFVLLELNKPKEWLMIRNEKLSFFAKSVVDMIKVGTYSQAFNNFSFEISTSAEFEQIKILNDLVNKYAGNLNKNPLLNKINNMIADYEKKKAEEAKEEVKKENEPEAKGKGMDGMRSLLDNM